jgi:hypothetical protein
MDRKIYSKNVFYIKSSPSVTNDILKSLIEEFSTKAFGELGYYEECRIIPNMLSIKGEPIGAGYCYVGSSIIVNLLLGKDEDGTDRIRIIEDLDLDLSTPGNIDNWADASECKTEYLPPLIPIPEYGEEAISFELSFTIPSDDSYSQNILYTSQIGSLTSDDLYNHFLPYVTSDNEKYPSIRIFENKRHNGKHIRGATIGFNSRYHDAHFALLMNRKTVINNTTVFFNYKLRSKRNMQ